MATAIQQSGYNPAQLRTIKETVAKDSNDLEFDLFMEAARAYGLDPFRNQIHAVVYSKNNPEKRKQTIIVSRDGYRILAQRCGDYRPASEPPSYTYDENLKGPNNPVGIVSVVVTLHKQDDKGEWFPVSGEAYWDEFAPLKDEWAYDEGAGRNKPTGKRVLDASGQWAKMPRIMIAKCAESQALRAGWPDQFGKLYSEEEMDRLAAEASASEEIAAYKAAERQERIGGAGTLVVFDDTMKLEKVSFGDMHDRCSEFISSAAPEQVHVFRIRNENALREFWANEPDAALDIKAQMEAKEALITKELPNAAE